MEYNFVQGLLTPEQALRARPTVEAPAQTPVPAQPVEVNPTQVVNQAVNHGIQQEQLQNATQQIAQEMNDNTNTIAKAANLLGVPEQGENYAKYANQRYFTKGLLGYKEDYARAEALGDAAGMQAATQGAMALRNLAQENGIDISGFGADNNLYESRARYDYNNMQHLLDMDDDMDSGAYYSRLYNEYKDKGMSDKGADMYAAQKADEYQRNRIRRMKDEFYANGFTNGAINPYGERLIDMIHDESPEALTAIATRLPGYMQEYIYQIGERQKGNAFDRTLKAQEIQHGYQKDILHDTQQFQSAQTDKQIAAKERAQDKDIRAKLLLASLQAGKKKADGSGLWEGELPADELKKRYELSEQWKMEHPNADPASNPHIEAINKSEQATKDRLNNNYFIPVNELKDYKDAYHNAAVLLDLITEGRMGNRPDEQQYTMDDLAQFLEHVAGSYAPQIIQEWSENPQIREIFK